MASKFGLGRGLADIQAGMGAIPDISILTGGERVVIKQIPLVQIGANPDQPRKTFKDAELNDLAASIKEKGVLQPILLRAVSGRSYNYEIVAGERRFRASKLAGLTEIPAVIKKLDDNNAMEIALIENVQRENLDPIEEAAAYKNLIDKCNYDMADKDFGPAFLCAVLINQICEDYGMLPAFGCTSAFVLHTETNWSSFFLVQYDC